jgi:hypothetical protein
MLTVLKSLLIEIIIYSFVCKFEVLDENVALLNAFYDSNLMIFRHHSEFLLFCYKIIVTFSKWGQIPIN